jgi:UDP-glucose 4-epimerase
MKRKVLVIGGDSFIAGHFIKHHTEEYNFTIVSRQPTGFSNETELENLFEIPDRLFEGIETVINYAAIVHRAGLKDENLYRKINCELPIHLAHQSIANRVNHFIQMSSISVYGNSEVIDENTPCLPVSLYGKYKLKADEALIEIAQKTNLKMTIVRPSMVYGGGRAPGNMLKLIKMIQLKLPIPFSGINNHRQFLNISNYNTILKYIIDKNYTGLVILADPDSISTSDLVDIIKRNLGIKKRKIIIPGFWWFFSLLNKEIVNSLTGNLEIKNTIPYNIENNKKVFTLEEGLIEMITLNKNV